MGHQSLAGQAHASRASDPTPPGPTQALADSIESCEPQSAGRNETSKGEFEREMARYLEAGRQLCSLQAKEVQPDGQHAAAQETEGQQPEEHDLGQVPPPPSVALMAATAADAGCEQRFDENRGRQAGVRLNAAERMQSQGLCTPARSSPRPTAPLACASPAMQDASMGCAV